MEIKIFVVETKLLKNCIPKDLIGMLYAKSDLINLFGGITELPMQGSWKNKSNEIEHDKGKLWLIYSQTGYNHAEFKQLRKILHRIKRFTQQNTQMYAINNEPHYI